MTDDRLPLCALSGKCRNHKKNENHATTATTTAIATTTSKAFDADCGVRLVLLLQVARVKACRALPQQRLSCGIICIIYHDRAKHHDGPHTPALSTKVALPRNTFTGASISKRGCSSSETSQSFSGGSFSQGLLYIGLSHPKESSLSFSASWNIASISCSLRPCVA